MKIQVFGFNGMLGKAVCSAIERRGHDVVIVMERLGSVSAADIVAPVVVNCAGMVKQLKCSASEMLLANSYGPQYLAEVCDLARSRLIHISTDCLFHSDGPHNELSPPQPNDIYSVSKLAGEVTRPPHLTLRTSFVGFGRRGLLHQLETQPSVYASRNLLWSGHTVQTIADVLVTLAERPDVTGLLHTPGQSQSRVHLVERLIQRFELSTTIIEDNSFVADRRLASWRWWDLDLPVLPVFATQLQRMERP